MSHKANAKAVIEEAEEKLRDIARDALAEGDYTSVNELTRLAKVLAELQSGLTPEAEPQPMQTRSEIIRTRSVATASASSAFNTRKQRSDGEVVVQEQDAKFPRFERQGKRLVKLGWSSRDSRIYEHRAPYDAVDGICRSFLEKAGSKRILRIDKVLPVRDQSGDELPSYQVYLVLKWLQEYGVIQKQGKDGYVIADPDFNFKSLWESTPAK